LLQLLNPRFFHIAKILFASVLLLHCSALYCSASDTLAKSVTTIKPTKLADGHKRLAAAFNNNDTTRIVKKHATFTNKNASKSAQDPNALSFGTFKVSEQLYGSYAPYILEYVKNYHSNFGGRMGRIKTANRSNFTHIDNTMRKNSIPKEMHSLAVIESGLNPNATSPVGAVGPWQFMPATAQMLGMQVTELQDDRRDFIKSTQAAVKFTKRLHNIFHDWLLVVAAYNCGPAPVIRHLAKTGSKSFWDIKQYLPKETQNHVMAFIATSLYYDKNSKVLDLGNLPKNAKAITPKDLGSGIAKKKTDTKKSTPKTNLQNTNTDESDLAVNNDEEVDTNNPQILPEEVGQTITLKLKGAYNLEAIADVLECDVNKLRRWNPKFNEQAVLIGNQVKLMIPSSKIDAFLIQKEKILKQSLTHPNVTSTAAIFEKQNKETAKNNIATPLTPNNTKMLSLEERKRILLAQLDKKVKPTEHIEEAKQLISEKKRIEKKTYIIKKGDNLNQIAEQFGMTIARIMEINNLKEQLVVPGHKLFLE
jgi:soluble lytic murein transglycosylase-like protein/LysM repeat protein